MSLPDPAAAGVAPDGGVERAARSAGLRSSTARALALGAALYNRGFFYEAHEAWEEAWLAEEGRARLLLQGLIQLAAGFHKAFGQRQPGGCVKLLGAGAEKLAPLGDACGGVRLRELVEGALRAREAAARWHAGEGDGPARDAVPEIAPVAVGVES